MSFVLNIIACMVRGEELQKWSVALLTWGNLLCLPANLPYKLLPNIFPLWAKLPLLFTFIIIHVILSIYLDLNAYKPIMLTALMLINDRALEGY